LRGQCAPRVLALPGAGKQADDFVVFVQVGKVLLINFGESPADQIDAGHTWEPHTSRALAKGQHIIFTSADTPGLIPDLLVFRTKILRERPDDVRAFLTAWLEARDFILANPAEAAQIIAEETGLSVEEVSFEGVKLYSLEDNRAAFAQNPGTDTTSIYFTTQLYADFLISSGNLTNAPDINQMLDPSFLP